MPILLANAGVPMLFYQWSGMVMALVPIVAVEAAVISVSARQRPAKSLAIAATSNAASTLVGVPIAWFLSFLGQLVFAEALARDHLDGHGVRLVHEAVLRAAWLHPVEFHLHWMVPVASMVLLLPALVVSVAVEGWITRSRLPDLPRRTAWAAVVRANLVSYTLLLAYCVWRFAGSVPGAASPPS